MGIGMRKRWDGDRYGMVTRIGLEWNGMDTRMGTGMGWNGDGMGNGKRMGLGTGMRWKRDGNGDRIWDRGW